MWKPGRAKRERAEAEQARHQAALDEVRGQVAAWVRAGFETQQAIAGRAVAVGADFDLDDAEVRRVVEEVWSEHSADLAAKAAEPSEYDRLVAAFAALDGFTTRMHQGATQEEGHERLRAEQEPGTVAYVFFDATEAERIGASQTLMLSFGFYDDHPDAPSAELAEQAEGGNPAAKARWYDEHDELEAAVGRRVVRALREQGLRVEWSGVAGYRPAVLLTDWRKPLPD